MVAHSRPGSGMKSASRCSVAARGVGAAGDSGSGGPGAAGARCRSSKSTDIWDATAS